MDSKIKSDFAVMCRALRVEKGLKQREVAELIGVAPATWGNVESSAFKVINRQRALKLIEKLNVPTPRATELLEAWDRCPLSEFGKKRKDYWSKRNIQRNKARHHDRLKFALVGCLGIILMDRPDDAVCECDGTGATCTVCYALEAVGAARFTPADRDKILRQLAKAHEDLLPKQAVRSEPDPIPAEDEIFGG